MTCLKWRRTYSKSVIWSPKETQFLAQITYTQGIWAALYVEAGNNNPGVGSGAIWLIPIRLDLDTGVAYKIVRPHYEAPVERLQLDINVQGGVAKLRLVNLDTNLVYTWIKFTLVVYGQDDPVIQELEGTGTSLTTDYYLSEDSTEEAWVGALEAERAAREAGDAALTSALSAEIVAREAAIDAEIQARLAQMAQILSRLGMNAPFWEIVTNGDLMSPEILFADGAVILVWNG